MEDQGARERIQKLLVTGDNRLKQGVQPEKARESYEQALAVAREAGLEESVRPLVGCGSPTSTGWLAATDRALPGRFVFVRTFPDSTEGGLLDPRKLLAEALGTAVPLVFVGCLAILAALAAEHTRPSWWWSRSASA